MGATGLTFHSASPPVSEKKHEPKVQECRVLMLMMQYRIYRNSCYIQITLLLLLVARYSLLQGAQITSRIVIYIFTYLQVMS
jgi:hypothetical protein